MPPIVTVQQVASRKIAAVTRTIRLNEIAATWKPALDLVWAHLRENPGLRIDGHNVFLYHHPARRSDPMPIDFGVEVVRAFDPAGEVHGVDTPAGEAAVAVHIGPYARLAETHDAIHAWAAENNREIGAWSMEVYRDWSSDESKLETMVVYALSR